jgi:hypothetical protein
MSLRDIFINSKFGIEIEGCSNYLSIIDECDSEFPLGKKILLRDNNSIEPQINIDRLVCYANKYINSNCIPVIITVILIENGTLNLLSIMFLHNFDF